MRVEGVTSVGRWTRREVFVGARGTVFVGLQIGWGTVRTGRPRVDAFRKVRDAPRLPPVVPGLDPDGASGIADDEADRAGRVVQGADPGRVGSRQ